MLDERSLETIGMSAFPTPLSENLLPSDEACALTGQKVAPSVG